MTTSSAFVKRARRSEDFGSLEKWQSRGEVGAPRYFAMLLLHSAKTNAQFSAVRVFVFQIMRGDSPTVKDHAADHACHDGHEHHDSQDDQEHKNHQYDQDDLEHHVTTPGPPPGTAAPACVASKLSLMVPARTC